MTDYGRLCTHKKPDLCTAFVMLIEARAELALWASIQKGRSFASLRMTDYGRLCTHKKPDLCTGLIMLSEMSAQSALWVSI